MKKRFDLFLLLAAFLSFSLLLHAQDQRGFISIDCGSDSSSTYTNTAINYVADVGFIDTGTMMTIPQENITDDLAIALRTLRSFPEGVRNCYNIKVEYGTKYLIRASFLYYNYDGKNSIPEFDIHFGPNFWTTVKLLELVDYIIHEELIHITTSENMQICLVNTGNGIPFISTLELRPLPDTTYKTVSGSLHSFMRLDIGAPDNKFIRFPDDIFDRIWSPPIRMSAWTPINSSSAINNKDNFGYMIPSSVLSTASTVINASDPMKFSWSDPDPSSQYYIYLYFAEIEILKANETRSFQIFLNDKIWLSEPLDLPYLKVANAFVVEPLKRSKNSSYEIGRYSFKLSKSGGYPLPPILNALEIFKVINLTQSVTLQDDADAIKNIELIYGIRRINWQGDPCSPKALAWEGLSCSYDGSKPPRITALNFSSSGLTGVITTNISTLKMLEVLDLSNNKLKGPVPDFLAQMPLLKVLNLNGNNLSGEVPAALIEKQNQGSLNLSWSGNPNLHVAVPTPIPREKTKKNVVPIVAAVGGVLVLSLAIFTISIFYRRKRRANQGPQRFETLESIRQHFSYTDILIITDNLKRLLGEGGFGKVYYGIVNKIEVAAKMLSPTSIQGYQQFQAEVDLLLRVHHKNLISLVGYCNEDKHLGLIYEYMGKGDLGSLLLDEGGEVLSWKQRLHIAMDAAEGLEYLHNACRPPMVHRDIKTANILLNNNFQAKLADFGLTRTFQTKEGITHVTTNVVGTPCYLDPEYYQSLRLTEKSDVYSFGIVLLEIITGRPVFTRTEERSHIVQWVDYTMKEFGDINSIIDPKLKEDYDSNSAWRVVDIAMTCVNKSHETRPTMIQVVHELRECLNLESNQTDLELQTNAETTISRDLDCSASGPIAR